MTIPGSILALFAAFALVGCATTQEVTLAKSAPTKPIVTIAQVPKADNSEDMDAHLAAALLKEGMTLEARLPAGTRKSARVDAIVSYSDVWRWDVAMYLKSLSIQIHDAQSGLLLASGEWKESALHGFRDAGEVVRNLVHEVFAKLNAATPGGNP